MYQVPHVATGQVYFALRAPGGSKYATAAHWTTVSSVPVSGLFAVGSVFGVFVAGGAVRLVLVNESLFVLVGSVPLIASILYRH